MSIRISYKISKEQHAIAWEFSRRAGLSLETLAKHALFYTINEAIRRKEEQRGKSKSGNTIGDNAEVSKGQDVDTNILAESQESGDQIASSGADA